MHRQMLWLPLTVNLLQPGLQQMMKSPLQGRSLGIGDQISDSACTRAAYLLLAVRPSTVWLWQLTTAARAPMLQGMMACCEFSTWVPREPKSAQLD